MHVRTTGYICVPTLSTYGEVDPFCHKHSSLTILNRYIYENLKIVQKRDSNLVKYFFQAFTILDF